MGMTERGRLVAQKVIRRIGEVTPLGLGRWDDAWTLVEKPSDAFLDALAAWEREDTPITREGLQDASDSLVRAWRKAGETWESSRLEAGAEMLSEIIHQEGYDVDEERRAEVLEDSPELMDASDPGGIVDELADLDPDLLEW